MISGLRVISKTRVMQSTCNRESAPPEGVIMQAGLMGDLLKLILSTLSTKNRVGKFETDFQEELEDFKREIKEKLKRVVLDQILFDEIESQLGLLSKDNLPLYFVRYVKLHNRSFKNTIVEKIANHEAVFDPYATQNFNSKLEESIKTKLDVYKKKVKNKAEFIIASQRNLLVFAVLTCTAIGVFLLFKKRKKSSEKTNLYLPGSCDNPDENYLKCAADEILKDYLNKDGFSVIAIYGIEGIGKSTIVRQALINYCKGYKTYSYVPLKCEVLQKQNLQKSFEEYYPVCYEINSAKWEEDLKKMAEVMGVAGGKIWKIEDFFEQHKNEFIKKFKSYPSVLLFVSKVVKQNDLDDLYKFFEGQSLSNLKIIYTTNNSGIIINGQSKIDLPNDFFQSRAKPFFIKICSGTAHDENLDVLLQEIKYNPGVIKYIAYFMKNFNDKANKHKLNPKNCGDIINEIKSIFRQEKSKLQNDLSLYLLSPIRQFKKDFPESWSLLVTLSFLNPDGISKSIIKYINPSITDNNISNIMDYHFLEVGSDKDIYHMSRLLQEAVLFEHFNREEQQDYESKLPNNINKFFDDKISDSSIFERALLLHAVSYYERERELLERFPQSDKRKIEVFSNLGEVLWRLGGKSNYEKSIKYRKDIIELQMDKALLAESLNRLGTSLQIIDEDDEILLLEALNYSEKSLEIRKEIFGDNDLELSYSYNTAALALDKLGKRENSNSEQQEKYYSKAFDYAKNALRIRKNSSYSYNLLSASYNTLASIRSKLSGEELQKEAITYKWDGDFERANLSQAGLEAIEAKKYKEQATKDKSIDKELAAIYAVLGSIEAKLGNKVEGKKWYEETLKIRSNVLGENSKYTLRSLNNLVDLLKDSDDLKELKTAKDYAERMVNISESGDYKSKDIEKYEAEKELLSEKISRLESAQAKDFWRQICKIM